MFNWALLLDKHQVNFLSNGVPIDCLIGQASLGMVMCLDWRKMICEHKLQHSHHYAFLVYGLSFNLDFFFEKSSYTSRQWCMMTFYFVDKIHGWVLIQLNINMSVATSPAFIFQINKWKKFVYLLPNIFENRDPTSLMMYNKGQKRILNKI